MYWHQSYILRNERAKQRKKGGVGVLGQEAAKQSPRDMKWHRHRAIPDSSGAELHESQAY
jgi:hypothetical protein